MHTGRKICFLAYTLKQIGYMRDFRDALPPGFSATVVIVALLKWCSYFFSSRLPDGVSADEITILITPHLQKKLIHSPALDTPQWHNNMFRWACRWYRCYHWYLQRCDVLVIWGGFAMPLAVAALVAEKLGRKVIYIESGVLPGTIALDLQGVNYNCSLRNVGADFYRSHPYNKEELSALQTTLFPQRSLRKKVSSGDSDAEELPSRFALFAMQVHDDTQIRCFSPRFSSMFDAVKYVYSELKKYNQQYNDNLLLVVKEHPSDYGRIDYGELFRQYPHIVFLRTTPIRDLIRKANLLITINSSVAVEAMLTDLPVITLGDAFFNIPGLCSPLKPGEELSALIPRAMNAGVDMELRNHFTCYLYHHYLLLWPKAGEDSMKMFCHRIAELVACPSIPSCYQAK